MTFNEDQLKAYIQQTAWKVGDEYANGWRSVMDDED
jgi:hypothetical protein